MSKPFTTEQFIAKAISVHGDRYVYSATTYTGSYDKVIITCRIHGNFLQTPIYHTMNSSGCRKCYNSTLSDNNPNQRWNNEKFITAAKLKHNNFYDYSLTNLVKICDSVTITCPLHGSFIQKGKEHIKGNGCKVCGYEKVRLKCVTGKEKFIDKASKKHNNRYSYEKVEYINKDTHVTITCNRHGDFLQSPHSHLNGNGCSKCNLSKGEALISYFLNKNNIEFVQNKTFSSCVNPETKQRLRFDFYIASLNTCIEFDGEQHFKPWRMKNKDKAKLRLKSIKYRDELKNQFCKNNHIPLLRIKYDENVLISLKKFGILK